MDIYIYAEATSMSHQFGRGKMSTKGLVLDSVMVLDLDNNKGFQGLFQTNLESFYDKHLGRQ